jgi:hypothetical protein
VDPTSLSGLVLQNTVAGLFMALAGFLYGSEIGFGTCISIANELTKSSIDQTLAEYELYDQMVRPLYLRIVHEKDPETVRSLANLATMQYERWKERKGKAIPLSLSVRLFFWRNMTLIIGTPLLVFVGIYGVHELLALLLASPAGHSGFQLLDDIFSLSLPAIIGYTLALGMMAIGALVDRSHIDKEHFGLVGDVLGVMLFAHTYLDLPLPDFFAWAFVVYHVALLAGVYFSLRGVNADQLRVR